MKTALDFHAALLDAGETRFVENVRKHGWAGTHVAEGEQGPGFSYTTGFWHRFGAPELVLFSLPWELVHQIFWNFFRDLESGKRFSDNVRVPDVLEGYDVVLKPVAPRHFPGYLGWNRWFYRGDDFQAWQVIFPDMSGLFPWDEAADPEFRALQPDLATPHH